MKHSQSTLLEGHIDRVTFRNDATHFVIARFRRVPEGNQITVLGHLSDVRPGEMLRLKGTWTTHPRYGEQFKVDAAEILLPQAIDEIQRYLASGAIPGVGPAITERLIAHFHHDTLAVIEQAPQRLVEVHGIGAKKAHAIGQAWKQHHAYRTLMQFLQAHDIRPAHAAKVYRAYGVDAVAILRDDPYRAAIDIPRVGFQIADAIVRHSDFPVDERARAEACLRHLLELAAEEGHAFIAQSELLDQCGDRFALDYHALQEAFDALAATDQVIVDTNAPGVPVYLVHLHAAEVNTAQRMQAMLSIPMPDPGVDAQQILETVLRRLAIRLSDTQLDILQQVISHRLVLVTGGPGTGKTTLIRAIAALFKAMRKRCVLAAPTGRAARRVSEVSGQSASTIHKLLGYNVAESRFEYNKDNPLDIDALVVDEASMVDLVLMDGLIRAIPHHAALVLVGDVFQLPSVGPGTVLADLIGSGIVPAYALNEVFRQAARSPIIENAHRVRNGQLPQLTAIAPEQALDEFPFIEQLRPRDVVDTVVSLCTGQRLRQHGIDPLTQVQVLTPMHKGPLGTIELNRRLKAALNPSTDTGMRFHVDDKVMQLRNNYDKQVFNGEIGTIRHVDATDRRFWIAFDGREIEYDEADQDELTLAYAISVHKSQGSEYPAVILVLSTQHYVMLQRNLLYTALTRARQMLLIVGSAKAVRVATQANAPTNRRSLLKWRLNPDVEGDFEPE